jgi:hypothetical protein
MYTKLDSFNLSILKNRYIASRVEMMFEFYVMLCCLNLYYATYIALEWGWLADGSFFFNGM